MAGVVGSHHRPIGSFNPAWCLRPQTGGGDIAMRWDDSPLTSISRLSTSTFSLKSSRPRRSHHRRGTHASSAAAEPTSPKVGCMGQIKRDKAAGGGGTPVVSARLLNLRKLFAGRSVFPLPGVAVVASPPRAARAKARSGCGGAAPVICVAELDPPLPVLKRAAGEDNQVCLWRRRLGEEMALEGLHLQPQMQLPPLCIYQAAAA
ncbi:hypothetical protein Taro_036030 [Colocasia esculenta]|uniref:Uncharacterized protein n=1 Tax=Colocasia esculenta TaxID=4460 RepID=A0A843WGK8_COLES|nr:hypothetical protein [Colocasia esculenta]